MSISVLSGSASPLTDSLTDLIESLAERLVQEVDPFERPKGKKEVELKTQSAK